MFTWIGTQFTLLLSTYVLGVVSTLMTAIAPIALTATTLWVALYGWAVLRNEVSETVPTFLWKVFKIGLVLAFALQAGFYILNVSNTADALASGVAATFLPATADPMTVSSPYATLDAFNDQASLLVLDLLKDAGITRLDLLLAAVVCSIGNVVFLCIALFVVTLAKLFLTFVIAIGPIFILSLAWRPTARFFDSWLSMVLNSVVLTWFAFFALGLSVYMGQAMVQVVQSQGGFQGPTFNVVGESLRYCVVMILMAIICFQAPSLASALTGGAAVQQGIQMVQNAMMVAGLRSASGGRGAAFGAAGGVVRAGTGIPYQAVEIPRRDIETNRSSLSAAHFRRSLSCLCPGKSEGMWLRDRRCASLDTRKTVFQQPVTPPGVPPVPWSASAGRPPTGSLRCAVARDFETSGSIVMKRIRIFGTLLLALGLQGARAQGIPVIDTANLVQTVQQVMNDITAIRNQVQQITQLQSQLNSINGIRRLGQVFNNPLLKNYIPAEAYTYLNAIETSGYSGLNTTAKALRDAAMVYNCMDLAGGARTACQAALAQPYQQKGLLQDAMKTASGRLSQINSLMDQINGTSDQKAIQEVQARIGAENALLAHEMSQVQMLQGMADSEERIARSRERERQYQMLGRTGKIADFLPYHLP